MSEQQNESVAGSAEQQPAQQVETTVPEGEQPAPAEQVEQVEQPAPDADGHSDPDATDEPTDDERAAAGDGEVTQAHPYVPGFGVAGKFDSAGAQDAGDDTEGDRA